LYFQDISTYLSVTLMTTPSTIPLVAEWAAKIQRTPNSNVWEAYAPYLSIFFSMTFFIPYSQDFLNLVIAINRLTAIAAPAKHGKNSNGIEARLSMFGIMLWICSSPVLFYQLYFAMGGSSSLVITFGYPLVIMAKSLTPPLLLILANPSTRSE
ncbi:hypothetical protein PFISCL1PPCAC_26222, partial [Pristionchus fissidentatus]